MMPNMIFLGDDTKDCVKVIVNSLTGGVTDWIEELSLVEKIPI